METCTGIEDDAFFESDDLGLGFGFKPGGLPPLPQTPRRSPDGKSAVDQNTQKLYESLPNSPLKSPEEVQESCANQEEAVKDIISKLTSWKISSFLEKFTSLTLPKRSKVDDNITGGSQHPSCKKCRKKSTVRKGRRRRNSDSALDDNRIESKECLRRTKSVKEKTWHYFQDKDYKRLQNKLQKAKEEIETLTANLEHCQKELLEKYGAVKALHMHSRLEQAHHRRITKKAVDASKQLEHDVNMLQWELELKQSYLMDSEQTWAQRFDRVASENAALLVALHTRSDELRKLALDRIALVRERDELVAALEVRDRIKGESSPAEDGPYSSEEVIAELATLGACQCRGHNQEPCSCARAAVEAKREFGRITKQLEISRHNEEEARLTADAYRIAFEQQLNKNSSLIHELLHKSVPWTKSLLSSRRKAKHQDTAESSEEEFMKLMRSRDDKLVQRLVDMLSDKMEALAHQKMATKMLASKIREQEQVIKRLTTQERVFLPAQEVQDYEPDPPVSV
ncbi:coiled-coil domain-containing protein 125 [Exaiptasia diaphana]|uniref:Coiled-coil domain-containing protein 125 n=1 Tax=Exaiptasia diaphana TaxID=2652724 RepID=A0A913WXC4_EXADI|nr:coiled-coil domain-containing protein 125 [Exaiptasia diaphana]KXJ17129.1 Coiled-coil domain-containing protein 125 [Exaiptasia diaphana]